MTNNMIIQRCNNDFLGVPLCVTFVAFAVKNLEINH